VSSPEGFASAIVRAWTFVYTIGAGSPAREARRDEIASDLFEHARSGADDGMRSRGVAGQMLARCFLGIGADVSWRVQRTLGQHRAIKGEVAMSERMKRNWWIPGAVALIGAGIVFAFMSHANRIDQGWDPSALGSAVAVATSGVLFVVLPTAALSVRRAHPGWSFVMLLPAILVTLSPLLWIGDAVRDFGALIVLIPAAGIVTLVGVLTDLARASVAEGAEPSATA
jgi:uncharacterized membrane protein YhaH (DUF805 family)